MNKRPQKRKSNEIIPKYSKVIHKISDDYDNYLFKKSTDNIEIIDLNRSEIIDDLKLENDDDSVNSDDDWEDVSDREEVIEIDLNNNEKKIVKDERREYLKLQREELQLIHRSMLMCLVGRLKYINAMLESEEVKHFFFSILPQQLSYEKELSKNSVKILLIQLKSLFKLKDFITDKGDVKNLFLYTIEKKITSSYWLNVIIVGLLRRLGYESRIVSIFNPGPLKLSDLNKEKETSGILRGPTTYKPSTRGYSKKNKTDTVRKSKLLISPTKEAEIVDKRSMYFFGEILIPNTLYWMSFDVNHTKDLDDENLICSRYPNYLYALAVSGDGYMRDVAVRYDKYWCLSSRKLRLSDASYKSILDSVVRKYRNDADYVEDARVKDLLALQPKPVTKNDFKGHPVYVLGCDMLKYEVLDPPDTQPIDNFRNEKVYLRENIALAHTTETWLKQAMTVKEGEVPCKRVKTVMSRRREKQGKDPNVDLWGPWQVENYKPPKAKDGKVPVNRHGNVDLFKPCMLPEGCIHIRGLNEIDKVCKKLGIHVVPAMIGWAFTKCNSARPILDGWVVCKENLPVLREGWREYMNHKVKVESEKRSRRVVKNWSVLVRRILLRERMRQMYQL